ncbi:unnamed protein product, partial [Iphiclides podalirius]
MFVSNDKNSAKKKFQKPNILRRKVKVAVQRPKVTVESYESPDIHSLVTTAFENESINVNDTQHRLTKQVVFKQRIDTPNQIINKPPQKLISSAKISEENVLHSSKGIAKKANGNDITFAVITPKTKDNPDNYIQNGVNVESFLVGSSVTQPSLTFDGSELQLESVDKYESTKWCLDIMQDKVIKEHYNGSQDGNMFLEQKLDVVTTMVPLSLVSSIQKKNVIVQGEVVPNSTSAQNKAFDDLSDNPAKFKCDIANCNKEFTNKQKLKKHQTSHNKEGGSRPPRQTTVECPIKALHSDVEEPCGRIFISREDLLKHLNEEHTLDQANYICGECGRRFFWASGLRAHGRAHGRARVRGALACAWPGCGRVFRQPCRLREHTRAHTGDKPYPCKYPNCGWSFRTASKLVRHARRHTGERRHACGACGRAFLRREHLREHHARQHAPRARPPHACAHPGCQQSFNNMSSLYMHMKKVHNKEKTEILNTTLVEPNVNNTFTVSLLHEAPVQYGASMDGEVGVVMAVEGEAVDGVHAGAEAEAEAEAGTKAEAVAEDELGEQHAARTHCTWPLPRDQSGYSQCAGGYVLEDTQVEQSESSENNIYTIRSDLFLHGNVLTNEDSESMVGGAASGVGGGTGALTDDLGLMDAHPTIDLMQEELMYTDAVDESSFRVFLLSGEELT